MCELLAAASDGPFRIEMLWPLVERLERFGIAGFGWGAAWVDAATGTVRAYRDGRAFRDDEAGRAAVGATETATVLVHLRRPSRLSTLTLADTQPFLDAAGRFAFAHNGDFRDFARWRARYRREDRIHGRADSEVGARWLEDEWGREEPAATLARLHETFGGQANLAVLAAGGAQVYAGNSENPVFAFRWGDWSVAATGIYSLDRSFFRFVAPGATERRLVRLGGLESLRRAAVEAGTPEAPVRRA